MRFSTIAISAFFGALAAASNETVSIKDFGLRQNNGTVQAAWFNVEPENVYCSGNTTAQLEGVVTCGQSAFRFYLEGDNLSEYNLTVYKQLGPFSGIFGESPVPVYCHAGGVDISDFACVGVANTTILLKESL